jgi:hypothetical protein
MKCKLLEEIAEGDQRTVRRGMLADGRWRLVVVEGWIEKEGSTENGGYTRAVKSGQLQRLRHPESCENAENMRWVTA